MKQPKEFSEQSIRQKVKALPDTFYGNECNVSLNASEIVKISTSEGEPLRFDSLGISFCRKGDICSEVNLEPQTVKAGTLEIFTPGTIYLVKKMSPDCSLTGMAFSPFLVRELLKNNEITALFQHGSRFLLRVEKKDEEIFCHLTELFLKTLRLYGESSPVSKAVAAGILQFAIKQISQEKYNNSVSQSRSDIICRQFVALLNENKGTQRTISYYADKLCISNHYLSIAVKQACGKSVKSMIDKSVVTEIKILLRHTDLTIGQIADKMNFPSSSFLCKFFRTQTGISPLVYRKK